MPLSQSAAVNVVPFIARLVLAVVFIPAGYNKLMREAEFSGEEAKRLRELSVIASANDRASERSLIVPASLVEPSPYAAQAPTAPPAGGSTPPSKPSTDEAGSNTPTSPAAKPNGSAAPPVGAGGEPVKARALHKITLMVDKAGWPYQTWLAWAAAITEFVGGVCLILGLFTRMWALGLAVAMGVAFFLTSLDGVLATKIFAMPIPDFNRFASQLSLFALAFGLMLTGAGSASIDRRMGAAGGGGKKPSPADD